MNLTILVATHKPYWMPDDGVYLPIHAGRAGKADQGYQGDNTGEHISAKNANYCELTALYWAWKNLDCEYIGLCHYRRYFARKSVLWGDTETKKRAILGREDFEALLRTYDILLPIRRNYYIETVRSQYEHAHRAQDLAAAEALLKTMYPEYSQAFDTVMAGTRLHLWNMFVMKKELFDQYCRWLFPLLFELEEKVDLTGCGTYEARVYGFIAERLFNVWLQNQPLKSRDLPVVNLEPINWPKKICTFLQRKFR